jgi:hypothetical protein
MSTIKFDNEDGEAFRAVGTPIVGEIDVDYITEHAKKQCLQPQCAAEPIAGSDFCQSHRLRPFGGRGEIAVPPKFWKVAGRVILICLTCSVAAVSLFWAFSALGEYAERSGNEWIIAVMSVGPIALGFISLMIWQEWESAQRKYRYELTKRSIDNSSSRDLY